MKTFFNLRQHPHSDHYRDHVPLIAYHINGIKPEPYFLGSLYSFCCNCPCILQIGMDHNHTDYCCQVGIRSKNLTCTVCNKDWQECIGGVAENLRKRINRSACINIQESIIYHKVQGFHDTHKETAGNNSRNDRNKNISQRLDQSLERICL